MAKYRASMSFKVEGQEEDARVIFEFNDDMLGKILDAYEAFSLNGNMDMDFYVHKVKE